MESLNKVIGIISYLPDDKSVRANRVDRCLRLFRTLDEHFKLPIMLIAQNWSMNEINKLAEFKNQQITIYTYKKLGITGARITLREKFLKETDYDYVICCDDDTELEIEEGGVEQYLKEIDEHPNMFGKWYCGFPRLMAVSRASYAKLGYDYIANLEAERGEVWEDHCFRCVYEKLYPEDIYQFSQYNMKEVSQFSENDYNSTWYQKWRDDPASVKGDRNAEMCKKSAIIIALWADHERKKIIAKKDITSSDKPKNIFFCADIGPCGGIETFEYYIAKHFMKDPDVNIELWYMRGDPAQLALFSTAAKTVKWEGQMIECDNFFFPSRNCHSQLLDRVKAKNIIECFHMAEGLGWNTRTDPRVTKYIAVSDAASKEWEKVTHKKCETYYPIIEIEKPESCEKLSAKDGKLHLISCSRLNTEDKGSKLMKVLADRLDERGVDYEWTIFGLMDENLNNENIKFKGRTLDKGIISRQISKNDFFVQLSRAEGFGMSIAEGLHMEVPLVSTPITTLKEHLTDDSNCIVFNFDGSNVDEVIDKMLNNKYEFKYEGPSSDWKSLLCQK